MQRIDAYYLYQVGFAVHRLSEIRVQWYDGDSDAATKGVAANQLRMSAEALGTLINNSVFQLRLSRQSGNELLAAIGQAIDLCERRSDESEKVAYDDIKLVWDALNAFEPVLRAELGSMGVFLVRPKNAMDTLTLIEAGEAAFPPTLPAKVPGAIGDIRQAMSCIAFELPTAAAFHLHRANETVLKAYWDSVSNGETLPEKSTMGQIVGLLEQKKFGRDALRTSLRDIVNLHRNPTIHPEQSLSDVEEAINLYGAIRAAIGLMLQEIPEPAHPSQLADQT